MKILISIALVSLSLFASQDIEIKPTGTIQFRYEDRLNEYSTLAQTLLNKDQETYNDAIIGGTLGLDSSWKNYILNTTLYGVIRLKEKDTNKNIKSFYNNDLNGFIYLGEFNIKKRFSNQEITIGRQTYKTPLINDNYRITKNSYEGIQYKYNNSQLTFQSLYFNKVASSTLANAVPYNHKYGFLGFGLGYNTSRFINLSQHIINKDLSTNGALEFLLKYGDNKKYISFENLYVDNFFNTSSLILASNIQDIYLKAGTIYQFSVGNDYVEKYVESSEQNKKLKARHYQAQIEYKKENIKMSYSISKTPSNKNNIYNGTLFSPFSNKTSFVRGLNTSHAIIADTLSQKISLFHKINFYKLPLVLGSGYVKYDIGKDNGLGHSALKTSELFFHIKGYYSKNISATIQYSIMKNFDFFTKNTKNTKVAIEYKF